MNTTFKQTAKVGVAGSFINQMMSNNSTLPKVGEGATRLSYSDRHAYEVISVSKDYKTVVLEALDAVADKTKNCEMGHQNWILNPTGRFTTIKWRHGAWREEADVVNFVPAFIDAYNSEPYSKERQAEWIQPLFNDDDNTLKVVEGKTVAKKEYSKIRIIFGTKDHYYDWEF